MIAAMLCAAPAIAGQPPAAPIQVMVVGVYHFDNPGLDLNNLQADDVLAPARQRELENLTTALAAFRPTRIMVEHVAPSTDLLDERYPAFTPGMLASERNETMQIGFRLAWRLGLRQVFAIDEQPGPGEPDYFPFEAVQASAARNGQNAILEAANAPVAAWSREFSQRQRTSSIPALLAEVNAPGFLGGNSFYYRTLPIGDTNDQPGAVMNAMWYLRNAKIFGKLMHAARPGDRIVVIFGSGHNYWLRHFASETPGFRNVDPEPYLRRAARR